MVMVALAVLAAAGPLSGQTTIGFFDGPTGGGNTASGAVGMTGWVVADVGVRRVILQVDGVDVVQAGYGRPRPGVERQFPGFPDSAAAGFGVILNATEHLDGLHVVSARAELMDGTFFDIPPKRTLLFQNSTHNLRPFGRIDRPNRNADLVGNCDTTDPFRRFTVIEGWALDLGVEIGDSGIGFVEIMLDGVILANSRRDCRFDFLAGGFTDCYGLTRLDVENQYPFALDAPNAGFRFVLDVGALIADGARTEGHHTITIRAGDISNQNENIAELPVFFICSQSLADDLAFGLIEVPRPNRIYAGVMRFEGWALDADGVALVEVFVDGEKIGNADFGVDSRASVAAQYPGFPDTLMPVWRLFFDSNKVVDGEHQAQVFVTDTLGNTVEIGETSFIVDNVP
ncbi:MAG: hypothetical protein D6696_18145 [Acidobacteria bacterium]|nr:MAG: hypothetical protein D6696_18145 [Acidobacteriota bacterium]